MLITAIAVVLLVGCGGIQIEVEQDNWGKTTTQKAEFYAASDVPRSQIQLTRQWYEIASKAWGNTDHWSFGLSALTKQQQRHWTKGIAS